MKKIVLISCASKKVDTKVEVEAQNLYISSLFKKSLSYAKNINPDKIFILSAKHHLLDLKTKILPYDVSLINFISKRDYTKVLNQQEKIEWSNIVIQMLTKKIDLNNDHVIFLAGKNYIKPLSKFIKNIESPLEGLRYGERLKFLNENNSKYGQ